MYEVTELSEVILGILNDHNLARVGKRDTVRGAIPLQGCKGRLLVVLSPFGSFQSLLSIFKQLAKLLVCKILVGHHLFCLLLPVCRLGAADQLYSFCWKKI